MSNEPKFKKGDKVRRKATGQIGNILSGPFEAVGAAGEDDQESFAGHYYHVGIGGRVKEMMDYDLELVGRKISPEPGTDPPAPKFKIGDKVFHTKTAMTGFVASELWTAESGRRHYDVSVKGTSGVATVLYLLEDEIELVSEEPAPSPEPEAPKPFPIGTAPILDLFEKELRKR